LYSNPNNNPNLPGDLLRWHAEQRAAADAERRGTPGTCGYYIPLLLTRDLHVATITRDWATFLATRKKRRKRDCRVSARVFADGILLGLTYQSFKQTEG
jgi:hypothetical protein